MFEGANVLLRDVVGLAVAPLEGAETARVLGGVEGCRSQVERDLWVLLWAGRLDGCGRHLDILDRGLDNAMCPAFLSRDGKVTSRGTLCTEPSSCNTNHVERCIRTKPL